MSETWIGLSRRPSDRAIASRRLASALPNLRSDHKKHSNARERARRWRNRLRADESGPGAVGAAVGKTGRHSHSRAALLLHVRTPPIHLQSVHRRNCDFLHALAERSAASLVRRRRANARFFVRPRYCAREFARGRNRQAPWAARKYR